MKEFHLIYNPISGKGNTKTVFDKIQEWANSQTDIKMAKHETENIGHATAITRDLTSTGSPVTILVLGGDGTLNEVLNGVNDFDNTNIGILPYGSGNDFFKMLDIDASDPIALINSYLNDQKIRKIDYLLVNDKYRAINEIGLGMSAEVVAYRDQMKRFKPSTQYKIATFVRALFWKWFRLQVSVDNGEYKEVNTMWLTMNNGNRVGGGMLTAPEAKIDDGLMTVSNLEKFARIKTLSVLAKCKGDKIAKLKNRTWYHCKEIDIKGENMTIEYDGFLLREQSHINVKIIPNKINLLVVGKK